MRVKPPEQFICQWNTTKRPPSIPAGAEELYSQILSKFLTYEIVQYNKTVVLGHS